MTFLTKLRAYLNEGAMSDAGVLLQDNADAIAGLVEAVKAEHVCWNTVGSNRNAPCSVCKALAKLEQVKP